MKTDPARTRPFIGDTWQDKKTSCVPICRALLAVSAVLLSVPATKADRVPRERMAAYHETMIIVDEIQPNAGIMTYVEDHASHTDQYLLAKLIPFIETADGSIGPEKAEGLIAEDFPGGVEASFQAGGVQVRFELVALPVGRDTEEQDGAAFYRIWTEPATPVVLRCGGGRVYSAHRPKETIHVPGFTGGDTTIQLSGNTAILQSSKQPHIVGITSTGDLSVEKDEGDKSILAIRFEDGEGSLLVSYGTNDASAKRIIEENAQASRTVVDDYYDDLLQSRIETPEKVIDQAFRSAIYNMEYNWLQPFGWIECIHHWVSMFHMQHSGAAEWLDQADRSRMTTISQAERLGADGHAPHLWPGGGTYRAFGGTNQFFAWQIRHYWEFTADREFVQQVAPALDQVIAQTFDEYDPEGDLLLAWRAQIGNQEDYLHHPHNSSGPSIEGINMMRTRVMLADVLGDKDTAETYKTRIAKARTNLRNELWNRELGRFIYYKDPHGTRHLDGQYQTFIYPLIWNIVDPLDSWTGMRHLRDRLMGFDGEVYCSNNFPNHVAGTWGMQAGASQQPWGTWGLSAMGLRNEAYLPLRAISRWVMNDNLRGSWPEISHEPTPAYFSPPAGLFIQSVVEAIFGLNVDRPAGTLTIAPSFPDHWPEATLHLPGFQAEYRRDGNTLEYAVQSRDALARHVRWLLPPCRVEQVQVDGKPVDFKITPAVGCIRLSFDTPPATQTHITVRMEPLEPGITHPASIAEGEPFVVEAAGCKIKSIDDRCGVLMDRRFLSDSRLGATIQRGLLQPYLKHGRLGLLNFSRRTFFLYCDAGNGVEFWHPIDLTILPPCEVSPQDQLRLTENGAAVDLLIRNNTTQPLRGTATLVAARGRFPFDINIAARSESHCTVSIPKRFCSLLSPGDNACEVVLPDGEKLDVTLTASQFFEAVAPLKALAAARLVQIPLPEDLMADDTDWHAFRKFHAYHHPPWAWNKKPLAELTPGDVLAAPELPAVSFKLDTCKLIPVSYRRNLPLVRVDLRSAAYKKLYLLVVPFLDSHNMFAPVAHVTLERKDGRLIGRTLYFPGDLDWWCPKKILGDFATCRRPRANRFGLLPQLKPEDVDWREGKPDGRTSVNWLKGDTDMNFPQPEFWATCLPIVTTGSVMSIIEIDLSKPVDLNGLTLSTIGVEPALGLVAIVGETPGGMEKLSGSEWMPPEEFAGPQKIFLLDNENALADWTIEGEAFSIAPVPHLFDFPTLNSLRLKGETATGKAISPDFTLHETSSTLTYYLQGGNSKSDDGPGMLTIDLIDSNSGKRLNRHVVKGSHILRQGVVPIKKKWRGRKVHLELHDRNTETSYAWLGLREVTLSTK